MKRVTVALSADMLEIIHQHMKKHNLQELGYTANLRLILKKFAKVNGYTSTKKVQTRQARRQVEVFDKR